MDLQFWIWLVVIVITLIARANKKKGAPPPPGGDFRGPDRDLPEGGGSKPMTFEELLREIQGEKVRTRPEPRVPEKKQPEYVDYDDDLVEEEQDLEDVEYDASKDDEVFKAYEAAKREAFNRPSLEEVSPVGEVVRFDHFKEYDRPQKSRPSMSFLKDLKDPEGFRKAFIMSEILRRKY